MALLHVNIRSKILALQTSMDVMIPETRCPWPQEQWPVLYLLHGLTNDHTAFQRYTNIERYAEERHLAVVMPAVERSFYTNMKHGGKYWTFITEELPLFCHRMFRLSSKREDTFACGLSMGGYGAMKLALSHPERYCAAASLSGALDIVSLFSSSAFAMQRQVLENAFGSPQEVSGSENDLMHLLEQTGASRRFTPRLLAACGSEDDLLFQSRAFRSKAAECGVALSYAESPGGHTWDWWDAALPRVLDWFLEGYRQ